MSWAAAAEPEEIADDEGFPFSRSVPDWFSHRWDGATGAAGEWIGDFLDVLADRGEEEIDGQELVQEGAVVGGGGGGVPRPPVLPEPGGAERTERSGGSGRTGERPPVDPDRPWTFDIARDPPVPEVGE